VRLAQNPIITPAMVPPSRDDLEVVGVFNPAAARIGDEIVLVLRVAEAARAIADDELAAPIFDPAAGQVTIRRFRRAEIEPQDDSRVIRVGGEVFLTSISHLRLARSRNGVDFAIAPRPLLVAADRLESFGIEDARLTAIDGQLVLNYTAVSPHGIATALAVGPDLDHLERRGVVFAPPNRDVTIFPERLDGRYLALHRPMPESIGRPAIWLASSPDLIHWGDHRLVATARPGAWDDLKVGGGAPPVRVAGGWLAIYHGVRSDPLTYSLGALLLDAADPSLVLGRSRRPILAPEAPYERDGFFGNVVFTCGLVAEGDALRIYYGAADGVTAAADIPLADILEGLV
jgi:predicted GH43/DUF377 family glycosyl hydrolase